VGAFITTTMQTGAIDVGIRRLAIPIGSRPLAPERDAPAIVVGTRVRNPVRELLVDSTAREAIPHGGSVTVVTQRRVQEQGEEEGEDEGAA
jgi:hypothetical protein